MEPRHSFSLLSISGGGRTGRIHVMEGISTKTLCGRGTDGAMIHEGEWVDEILTSPTESATALCMRCREAYSKRIGELTSKTGA